MPLPSQLAAGKHSWRDYLIDFAPTQRDIDYYALWIESERPSDFDALSLIIQAEWKISITPSGNDQMPYVALTCKRSGSYLHGFTISLKGVGTDAALSFSAWLVQATISLTGDEIDGFLTLGSGWEQNEAENAQNSSSDDEIPF